MQKLVVILHADDLAHPSFAVVDDAGQVAQTVVRGDAALLADAGKDRMNIVVVPAEDVLLTSVTLPKMNRSRLMQALPYALEEQIIEDVETMHFAAGEHHADVALPVMVAARTRMQEWIALLQSFGITPDIMIPAVFALPYSGSVWHGCVNDIAVVRTGMAAGFACDQANLAEMLTLALSSAEIAPQEIELMSLHENLSLTLPATVRQSKIAAEQMLEKMALQAVSMQPVNLLQGEFQNKKSRGFGMPKMTNLLKVAAYLGMAWIAIAFLYPVVSFAILDQRAKDIKTQIAAIYKKEFPNASSIVAPKDRMQQKLNKLSSGSGDNHLMMMLANIGKGLSQASGVTLKRMDFQNNMMMLEISAASSDVFSSFTDALSQQGLRVKQQNANLSGARVTATLEIE